MSKARRIQKISVFTSGGKFSVFTLSYVNTALNQSAFRIHKCYIIIINNIRQKKPFHWLKRLLNNTNGQGQKRGNISPLFLCELCMIKAFLHELAYSIELLSTWKVGRVLRTRELIVASASTNSCTYFVLCFVFKY